MLLKHMRKLKLYLDSSVFGWSLNRNNPAWYAEANLLLKQIAEGKFIGAYSWLTEKEVNDAPKHIADRLNKKISESGLKKVPIKINKQAEYLAEKYCLKKIIPAEYKADALHIAIATLWQVDAVVSFNFEHIVKLGTMVAVNEINKNMHHGELFLCDPKEVVISDS